MTDREMTDREVLDAIRAKVDRLEPDPLVLVRGLQAEPGKKHWCSLGGVAPLYVSSELTEEGLEIGINSIGSGQPWPIRPVEFIPVVWR